MWRKLWRKFFTRKACEHTWEDISLLDAINQMGSKFFCSEGIAFFQCTKCGHIRAKG